MKYVVRENTAMHAICDAKFTSRTSVYCAPFKGFRIHSYGVQHATLCVVVSNCIDITFPTRPMLAIFGVVYLQVQNRESRLLIIVPLTASLNATRVVRQTRCNDYSCTLTQRIFSYTNTIRSCVSILCEQYV